MSVTLTVLKVSGLPVADEKLRVCAKDRSRLTLSEQSFSVRNSEAELGEELVVVSFQTL